jgi:predicted CXXCH cytochrome family protein
MIRSILLAILLLSPWLAQAQPVTQPVAPATRPAVRAVVKPTKAVAAEGCVTAECHASIKAFKVVHGPVNVNACDACHSLKSEVEHTYELARNKTETCTFCHKVEIPQGNKAHKPLADGQCLSCHNPHGGTNQKFVRGASMAEMCASCHQDNIRGKKAVHGPVAAGSCDSCHTSHSSQHAKLLVAPAGKELCLTCHAEMKTQLGQVKFVHKAMEQDCAKCHDAHASDYAMQTHAAPDKLCTNCHEHEKIKKDANEAKHKHSVVMADKSCLNCHNSHGGNLAKLMKAEQATVCMKCHAKEVKSPDGRKVAAIPEILDKKTIKHGPIRDGDCGGCHNPHGSEESRLLAKHYPESFYQAFKLEKYDLCFSCHDKQLVLAEKTPGLTKFRNGEQNLHYTHVNKEKGRNCRSCHMPHASSNELHIRETVPYGNWSLPIKFTKSDSGGSCSPGCHKPYAYDRDNAKEYAK